MKEPSPPLPPPKLPPPPRPAALAPPPRKQDHVYRSGDVLVKKYRLDRKLGEGGMGEVWLARNDLLGVNVAVKLIRSDVASAETSARLQQEARAAALLDHPSIVRVFDFGHTESGDPFIVMEFVDGEPLCDLLDRKGRLPALTAVRTLLPITRALAAAHAKGIVHRDMKPENILLVPTAGAGVLPKVVDFGIAILRRDGFERRLTQVGTIIGSPDYMAPEQARGSDSLDQRVDVWSMSVILYQMITGVMPFRADNYNALLTAILIEDPVATTQLGAGDAELWSILERGLEKSLDARWSSMRSLGAALASWAMEEGAVDDVAGGALRAYLSPDAAAAMPESTDRSSRIDASLEQAARAACPADELPTARPPAPSAAEATPFAAVDHGPPTEVPVANVPRPRPRRVSSALVAALAGGILGSGILLAVALGATRRSPAASHETENMTTVAAPTPTATAPQVENDPEPPRRVEPAPTASSSAAAPKASSSAAAHQPPPLLHPGFDLGSRQ